MNNYVLQTGSMFHFPDESDLKVHTKFPIGNYVIDQNPQTGQFFLIRIGDAFALPKKLYGDYVSRIKRIETTVKERKVNTGVMLRGSKGSGKTLLMKAVANKMQDQGYATILVNKSFKDMDAFNRYLQSIHFPCTVLFDEFEKVFGWQEQQKLLTLFDGTLGGRKLFIISLNDTNSLNSYLVNRPGRFYYTFDYTKMDKHVIAEYCDDHIKNNENNKMAKNFFTTFDGCNFDIMAAVIEEMNRFDEPVNEAIKYLNVRPESSEGTTFSVKLHIPGAEPIIMQDKGFRYNLGDDYVINVEGNKAVKEFAKENPALMSQAFDLEELGDDGEFEILDSGYDDDEDAYSFYSKHLVDYNIHTGEYIFERAFNKLPVRLVLSPDPEKKAPGFENYFRAF